MSETLALQKNVADCINAIRECYLKKWGNPSSNDGGEKALDLTVRLWTWYCIQIFDNFSNAPVRESKYIGVYSTQIVVNVVRGQLDDAEELASGLVQLLSA